MNTHVKDGVRFLEVDFESRAIVLLLFLLLVAFIARLERRLTPLQVQREVIDRFRPPLADADLGALLGLLEVEVVLLVDPGGHLGRLGEPHLLHLLLLAQDRFLFAFGAALVQALNLLLQGARESYRQQFFRRGTR